MRVEGECLLLQTLGEDGLINILSFIDIWEQHYSISLVHSSFKQIVAKINKNSTRCVDQRSNHMDKEVYPAGILYYIGCGLGTSLYSFFQVVLTVKVASGSSLQDQIRCSKINVPVDARIEHAKIWKCVESQENEALEESKASGFLIPPENPFRTDGRRASMVIYDDHFGKPEAAAIMDRFNPTRLFTAGENCWFVLDFGKKILIRPSSYALRYHRPVLKRDATPRNWKFEGGNVDSEGNIAWKSLRIHENDRSIEDQDGAFAVWDVINSGREKFRYFRILRIMDTQDRGRSGIPSAHPSLYISGFEVYGTLTILS
jgi:hypothetical protein